MSNLSEEEIINKLEEQLDIANSRIKELQKENDFLNSISQQKTIIIEDKEKNIQIEISNDLKKISITTITDLKNKKEICKYKTSEELYRISCNIKEITYDLFESKVYCELVFNGIDAADGIILELDKLNNIQNISK